MGTYGDKAAGAGIGPEWDATPGPAQGAITGRAPGTIPADSRRSTAAEWARPSTGESGAGEPGAEELGGDPPCYLPDVCEECGLLIEDRLADSCPRCGAGRG